MPAGDISCDVRPAQIIRQKLSTIEQAEAFFEKHHDPWKLRPMGRTFSATTTLLQLGDLRIWCAGSGPAHEMIPVARPSRCLVNFLTAGRMEARFGNEMAMLSEGQGWIRDSGRLEFVRKHPGLQMTSFDFPRTFLEDHLEKARSREASSPYQYDHMIDAREGTGRILANLTSVIINGLDTGQTLSSFYVSRTEFLDTRPRPARPRDHSRTALANPAHRFSDTQTRDRLHRGQSAAAARNRRHRRSRRCRSSGTAVRLPPGIRILAAEIRSPPAAGGCSS